MESPAAYELNRMRRGSSLLGDPLDRLAAPAAHREAMVASFPARRSAGSPRCACGAPGLTPPSVSPLTRVVGAPSHDASCWLSAGRGFLRSEEHTSELQSPTNIVCRLL